MATHLFTSVPRFLEKSRMSLNNAETDPNINAALIEFGLTPEYLAGGRVIYNNAREAYDGTKREEAESAVASSAYYKVYRELRANFKVHRDKALIFYKRRPEVLVQLDIRGRFPAKYDDFFNKTKHFYTVVKGSPALLADFARFKVTEADVDYNLSLHGNLLGKRDVFEKEMAESQDMTEIKDAALLELKEWMDEFYINAKLALYDHPQLLEALGIFVRS